MKVRGLLLFAKSAGVLEYKISNPAASRNIYYDIFQCLGRWSS